MAKLAIMNQGRTILSQLISLLPKYEFDKCVKHFRGNYKVQSFTCWEQFIVMGFAQLTYRESLRDIEACLGAVQEKLYHSGVRSKIARSTLADANESRDWRIYADFAQVLIKRARKLYRDDEDFSLELDEMVYALDSTTIDLCLSLFPWAKFRKHKGAVKLHTLLDLRGSIPTFIEITDGLVHDVNVLDLLLIEAGAFYVMDKGYIDYDRLYTITRASAYFVTRAKDNFAYRRLYSSPVDKQTGLRCDQTVVLTGHYAKKHYPNKLRRVKYYDEKTGTTYVFLTNNFRITALMVAQLYKERWQVELFFKWIKQHLRIKSFFGTTRNAVFTQIWIAICVYLIVSIMKKEMQLEQSLYTILQILSISIFEKMPLQQAFREVEYKNLKTHNPNQLNIFDL
jgi:hypothetical protein